MIKLRTSWMGGLALLAVLLGSGAGCEKKKDADKAKTEAPATGADAAGSGSAVAGSGSAAAPAAGSGATTAPATGSGSAAPVATGGESPVIAELHALKDTACACKDTACAEGVQKSFEGFIQKHMNTQPGPGEEKVAEEYASTMMECLMKAMGTGMPGADPDPSIAAPPAATTTGAASTGLPMCDQYIAAVEKFASCDKVPKETRDQTRASLEQMKGAWAQMAGMPEDARKSTNDACKQGLDAMVSGGKALGCDL